MENEINMENINELDSKIELANKQNEFLETSLGQIVNTAINAGLRFILPDLVEEQVIEVKDTLFESGLKEGIKKAIEEGIDLGKSVIGIFTGKFENINQMQNVVKSGGIIDSVSNIIDNVVTKGKNEGKISSNIATMIKKGKSLILDNITSNVESMLTDQVNMVERLNKYSNQWESFYKNKDFSGMDKEYKKIENILKKIAPLENVINKCRKIENVHNVIKNNGNKFDLSEHELELAKIL